MRFAVHHFAYLRQAGRFALPRRFSNEAQSCVFFEALNRGEVAHFLAGTPPYFIDAKNDNTEPQNVNDAFNLVIFAAWLETKDVRVPSSLCSGLLDVLKTHPDINRAIYVACDWIWLYSYCLNDKRKNPEGSYADLFHIDLKEVALVLRELLEGRRESLVLDKRWAGAEWNSKDGLWGPLVRQAIAVRDQLDGADFVPRLL